jgi:hypothetical protein
VDQVVGGLPILPATAEGFAAFVAADQAALDELTPIANVMNCPPATADPHRAAYPGPTWDRLTSPLSLDQA